jgi:hypothetical protein
MIWAKFKDDTYKPSTGSTVAIGVVYLGSLILLLICQRTNSNIAAIAGIGFGLSVFAWAYIRAMLQWRHLNKWLQGIVMNVILIIIIIFCIIISRNYFNFINNPDVGDEQGESTPHQGSYEMRILTKRLSIITIILIFIFCASSCNDSRDWSVEPNYGNVNIDDIGSGFPAMKIIEKGPNIVIYRDKVINAGMGTAGSPVWHNIHRIYECGNHLTDDDIIQGVNLQLYPLGPNMAFTSDWEIIYKIKDGKLERVNDVQKAAMFLYGLGEDEIFLGDIDIRPWGNHPNM